MAEDKLLNYQLLVNKLDAYIDFVNEADRGPIALAHAHGWRCPHEDVEKGKIMRDEIQELRNKTLDNNL